MIHTRVWVGLFVNECQCMCVWEIHTHFLLQRLITWFLTEERKKCNKMYNSSHCVFSRSFSVSLFLCWVENARCLPFIRQVFGSFKGFILGNIHLCEHTVALLQIYILVATITSQFVLQFPVHFFLSLLFDLLLFLMSLQYNIFYMPLNIIRSFHRAARYSLRCIFTT